MAECKLFCLGRPILEMDGKPVKLEMRKSLALLVYLRMADHGYSRETLSALFWPEYDQQHALANLRRALSSLNKSLQGELLKADREKIGLHDRSKLWLDVECFQDFLSATKEQSHTDNQSTAECLRSLENAIQLYRGNFLDGFNLGDCAEFDEWQFTLSESLSRDFTWALQKAAEGYEVLADWEHAIVYARRWVAVDRLHEPAQRFLIDLYRKAGQRSAGLKQYEELVKILHDELDQEPESETTALYLKIRDSRAAPTPELKDKPGENTAPPFTEPVLKTKLYIPTSRGQKVSRQSLTLQLNEIEQYPLAILSAPAGFGKTTSLVEWASQSSLNIGWYSLDNGDNDVVRFLTYLIAAFESIQSGIGFEASSLLRVPQSTPAQLVLTHLLNDLESLQTPVVLVLDDYQFITAQVIHDAVSFILGHLPQNVHLIIATRADPPLRLARLRSRRQLLEIRTNDLRFSPEEAFEYLNHIMGLPLTPDDLALLDNKIEGWIAGLQMAALSIQGREDQKKFIQAFSGSDRYILDYLTDEVLSKQTKEIQTFLIQTSILERLCSSICYSVVESEEPGNRVEGMNPGSENPKSERDYQAILEYLEQKNLFITPLDNERRWYRYHQLFADLLRSRLRQSQPGKEKILHDRAAGWYEQEGMINEAIQHAIAAKNIEQAVRLINQHALTMIANGEMQTVQNWLNNLPKEERLRQPWLDIYQGWVWLVLGQAHGVPLILDHAEKIIPLDTSETEDMLGNIALLRAEFALLNGKQDQSIEFLKDAQRLLSRESVIPRLFLPLLFGDEYLFTGDMEKASQYLREASDLSRQFGNIYFSLLSLDTLGYAYRFQGKLHEAESIFQEALCLGTNQCGQHSILLCSPLIGYSDVQYEWNNLEMALKYAEEGVRNAEMVGRANLLVHGYVALGQVLLAQGKLEGAREAIQKAEQWVLSHKVSHLTSSRVINLKLKFWFAAEMLEEINGWQSEYRVNNEESLIHPAILELVAQARKFFMLREDHLALNLLVSLERIVESKGLITSLVQIRLLHALILLRSGDINGSIIVFEQCITLAEPGGYLRTFIDEGPLVIQLIEEYQKQVENGRLPLNKRLQGYMENVRHAF